VVDDDRTHYEILGVDRRASKDKVRDAYRERLNDAQADQIAALESKRPSDDQIAGARREVARVREAWQVLSDPVQRQRYDARLGNGDTAEADGDLELADAVDDGRYDDDDDDDDVEPAARPRRPPRDPNRISMFQPDPPPKPASWPPNVSPPPPRARLIALLIDCFVLFVIFIGLQAAGTAVINSQFPNKTDRLDRIEVLVDRANNAKDKADTRVENRKGEAKRAAEADVKRLDNRINKLEEEQKRLRNDLLPATFMVTGATLLVMFLYLIPASVISGRTLGKRLLTIHLAREDGSPAGFRASALHYGAPVLLAVLFAPILGQLMFVIVLFGVLTWPRNPNLQGLHDRLAHTLVVDG
jgi:uncharacterized RDD family membrane protein YckC